MSLFAAFFGFPFAQSSFPEGLAAFPGSIIVGRRRTVSFVPFAAADDEDLEDGAEEEEEATKKTNQVSQSISQYVVVVV